MLVRTSPCFTPIFSSGSKPSPQKTYPPMVHRWDPPVVLLWLVVNKPRLHHYSWVTQVGGWLNSPCLLLKSKRFTWIVRFLGDFLSPGFSMFYPDLWGHWPTQPRLSCRWSWGTAPCRTYSLESSGVWRPACRSRTTTPQMHQRTQQRLPR